MKNVRLLSILIACCWVSVSTKAVVADPTPHTETLPDGRTIEVVLHGDEFHSYRTDLQGHIVAGQLPSAADEVRINQRKAARKLGGHFPLTGSPHSLVILAEYPDLPYTCTKADFDSLLMQSGYAKNNATGSCRDYFIASSDSIFQPIFDVYGPYEVSQEMSYYGGNNDQNAHKLIIEACQLASDDGVDFTQYDTDNDGIVDNVFVYYAGHNEAEGGGSNTIWPHQSNLSGYQVYIQGKKLASYACTSELKGMSSTTQCAIGTFCHEFGHVLGLPDWYDTSGNDKYTIGDWSIMCSGNYNNGSHTPPSYNAYERFYLGWLEPQQLATEGAYHLPALTMSNTAYLIANTTHNLNGQDPNPSEFFLLENRQKVGWDEPYMPGTGMLVWHVAYSASKWNQNNPNVKDPMGFHLEEAKGRRGTSSMSDPYPGSGNVTSFMPKLHNGTALSDQPIFNIEQVGSDIYFVYKNVGDNHLIATPDSIDFVIHKKESGKSIDWKAEAIHITGEQINPDERITITTGSGNFYITMSDSVMQTEANRDWIHTIVLEDVVRADSTLDTTFYACYKIGQFTCAKESGLITISSLSNYQTIRLSGIAPLMTAITTPQPEEETTVTPYAFTIHWHKVPDAVAYHLALYQSREGDTTYVQGFESFDDIDAVHRQGWESTTTTLTTSAKKEGQYALYVKNTGDQITSEIYPAPVKQVSFWVNAFSASEDSIGQLVLEATSDQQTWQTVQTTFINNRVKDKTYTCALDANNNYRQLRLTYTRLGGQGIALDAFSATINQRVTYIYKGDQLVVPAEEEVKDYAYTFTNLLPNNTYYYQLRCTDGGKGCSELITPFSEPRQVQTVDGADPDGNRLSIGFNDDEMTYETASRVIYLPRTEEGYSLYIYEIDGRLVWSTAVEEGQSVVYLPNAYFTYGQVYIAKYMATGKMSRKDKWVKFIYR